MAAISRSSSQSFPTTSDPSATKVSTSSSDASSTASVTKRLSSELMALMMNAPAGCSAFPDNDSDLTFWRGRIEGAEGTVYEGHVYLISLQFPPTYPYSAPTVKFETTCFHPNVDLHGNICLDILKEKWSPMLSVSTILISLQSLLGEPNNASPLNVDAADLWDKVDEYKKELAKHYTPPADE
ncbi:Ubiquitin-conjugating enzyme E2 C [Microbotryomycetes sp. NB124-2]